MARIVYHPDSQGNITSGPYNPLAGHRIKRAHGERTNPQVLRHDGSVAATEQRETLTLDTDSSSGPLMTGRQMRRLDSPVWRLLYWLRDLFYALIGMGFIDIGSAFSLSLTYDVSHSVAMAVLAVDVDGRGARVRRQGGRCLTIRTIGCMMNRHNTGVWRCLGSW